MQFIMRLLVVVATALNLVLMLKTVIAWADGGELAALPPALGLLASLCLMVMGSLGLERSKLETR